MKRGGVQEKGGGQDPLTPPSGHAYELTILHIIMLLHVNPMVQLLAGSESLDTANTARILEYLGQFTT